MEIFFCSIVNNICMVSIDNVTDLHFFFFFYLLKKKNQQKVLTANIFFFLKNKQTKQQQQPKSINPPSLVKLAQSFEIIILNSFNYPPPPQTQTPLVSFLSFFSKAYIINQYLATRFDKYSLDTIKTFYCNVSSKNVLFDQIEKSRSRSNCCEICYCKEVTLWFFFFFFLTKQLARSCCIHY